jgi:thiol-disulfide isomerase/thioredoxin
VAIALAVSVAGLASCSSGGDKHDPYIPPGKRHAAPALSGKDLVGNQVNIASSRGKTTVVNFWASYCGPCRAESAALRQVALKSPGTAFFGVDVEDSNANGLSFARDHKLPYPSVHDGLNEVATAWVVSALPQTFVVDPAGKVAARFFGAVTQQELTDMIHRVDASRSS